MDFLNSHIILSIAWIAYCALHSIFATTRWKQLAATFLQGYNRWYRLGYNLFALVGLVAIIYYQISITQVFIFIPISLTKISGVIIATAGLLMMLYCIRRYFSSLSGLFEEEKVTSKLIISGLHKVVRHPLYLGTFLFIWGAWLAYPISSVLISIIIITVYTLLGIRWEEKKLVARFGDDYKQYQQQVPMIIPGMK